MYKLCKTGGSKVILVVNSFGRVSGMLKNPWFAAVNLSCFQPVLHQIKSQVNFFKLGVLTIFHKPYNNDYVFINLVNYSCGVKG